MKNGTEAGNIRCILMESLAQRFICYCREDTFILFIIGRDHDDRLRIWNWIQSNIIHQILSKAHKRIPSKYGT